MMKIFLKRKKVISTILLAVFLMLSFSIGDTVHAEESLNKDGNANYTVDTVPDDAVEDEGWISKIGSAISDGVKWGVSKIPLMGWIDDVPNMSEVLPTVLNYFVDVTFKLNIQLTHALTFILELAFDFNMVNLMLEEVESNVQDISGIGSDGLIQDTGMFGTFGLIIVIITVIYAVFIVLFKRSMLSSFSVMLQTVVVITLAILLFTNFSFYMTGANKLTTQASSLILGGNSASYDITKEDDEQSEDSQSLKDGMRDNIWSMFVDRPFLYMMFGEINYSKLDPDGNGDAEEGRKRVEAVALETGEDRYEALVDDIKDNKNTKPLHSSVSERIAFTPLYFGINALVSIPILLLSLAMVLFQFWFLIIAVFAPFVFIIAAIPGQIGVLKQYGKELMIPLLLKMALSFFMLIFFVFSDVLYNLNDKIASIATSDATVSAILAARPDIYLVLVGVLNLMVFASILLLSRRIFGIFSASPLGKTALQPINSGVQSTASLVGAGVGAATGGVGGAMAGASLGGAVGKAATGEGSAGDIATSAMRAKYMTNLSNLNDGGESQEDLNATDNDGNESDNKQPITDELENESENEDDNSGINDEDYAELEKCPDCNQTPCVCDDGGKGTSDDGNDGKCPKCNQKPCVCDDGGGKGPSDDGNDKKCPRCNQKPCVCNSGGGSSSNSTNNDNKCPRCKKNPCVCDGGSGPFGGTHDGGQQHKAEDSKTTFSELGGNQSNNNMDDDDFNSQVEAMPSLDFGNQDETPKQNVQPDANFDSSSPIGSSSESSSNWGNQAKPIESSNFDGLGSSNNKSSTFGFGENEHSSNQNTNKENKIDDSNRGSPTNRKPEDHTIDRE